MWTWNSWSHKCSVMLKPVWKCQIESIKKKNTWSVVWYFLCWILYIWVKIMFSTNIMIWSVSLQIYLYRSFLAIFGKTKYSVRDYKDVCAHEHAILWNVLTYLSKNMFNTNCFQWQPIYWTLMLMKFNEREKKRT